jgi:endonuclease/exonuclease/phosphatase (EEP) superfamily protein YafD
MCKILQSRVSKLAFLNSLGIVVAILSLLGFLGASYWLFDLFSHFRVQYSLIFLFFVLFALFIRKFRWALFWLLLLLINVSPVLVNFFNVPAVSYEGDRRLKAMLFNVNSSTGDWRLASQEISRVGSDILVLQELTDEWLEKLEPVTRIYPYRVIETRDDNFGIGIFSKVPSLGQEILYLGEAGVPSARMDLELEGGVVSLVATHPLPPVSGDRFFLRNNQLFEVAGYVSAIPNEVLLAGDLNITPWSPIWSSFIRDSQLLDSSAGRGICPSWPSSILPLRIPIDHFLHSKNIVVYSKSVGNPSGSDHLPVIVDFYLQGSPTQ